MSELQTQESSGQISGELLCLFSLPNTRLEASLCLSVNLEGFRDAAPPLSPGSQRGLRKQAVHGPTENDGGGEGAGRAGLPLPEETEAGTARSQGS